MGDFYIPQEEKKRIKSLVSKSAFSVHWKDALCLCPFMGEKIEAIRGTEMPSSVSFLLLSVQEHFMDGKKQDNESFRATYSSNTGTNQFARIALGEVCCLAVLPPQGHRPTTKVVITILLASPIGSSSLVLVIIGAFMSSASRSHLFDNLAYIVYRNYICLQKCTQPSEYIPIKHINSL